MSSHLGLSHGIALPYFEFLFLNREKALTDSWSHSFEKLLSYYRMLNSFIFAYITIEQNNYKALTKNISGPVVRKILMTLAWECG